MELMCALCLYLPNHEPEDAVTVLEGYAVCSDHMGYVAQGTRWYALLEALRAGRGYVDTKGEF